MIRINDIFIVGVESTVITYQVIGIINLCIFTSLLFLSTTSASIQCD